MDVVESKCADGFGFEFGNGVRENSWNFKQAIAFLTDYIHKHRIIVPSNLREAVIRLKTGHHPPPHSNTNKYTNTNTTTINNNNHNHNHNTLLPNNNYNNSDHQNQNNSYINTHQL